MQLNTILKFGGLAFDVAQDEKVQQLVTLVHQGAKRRGLMGSVSVGQQGMYNGGPSASAAPPRPALPPVPFAPSPTPVSAGTSQVTPLAGMDFSKYLTKDNAKKALSFAGQLSHILTK
ncbi:hypothetical protein D2Q93_04105 [Alicyclobacillaceae bacterium I2511]|nr:hypothetical protein D2Q93_04105 [Alicyclobacillaceae bacterium I2511]